MIIRHRSILRKITNGHGITVELPGRDEVRKPVPEHVKVESLCWCEDRYVMIYPAAVRAGQTIACDRRECHPPGWQPAERIAS